VVNGGWLALALAAGWAFSGSALAKDPPVDPWSDADWRTGLSGLKPGTVRAVRWAEQVYAMQPGAESTLASRRTSRLVFDDQGRLDALQTERQRRGEREERRDLRYLWGTDGRMQRIDEAGAAQPLWQRQGQAGARVAIETERRGTLLWRTSLKHDAAGRVIERLSDAGKANGRVRERRTYHANGALKSIDTDTQGGPVRTVAFDPMGRPVKLTERDAQALRVTQIRYPAPLTAVHDDSGASLARGGLRKYSRELTFRVRQPDELLVAGEPAQPLSRREVRDGRVVETQTEFDDEGRVLQQRVLEGERVRCVTDWQYHASGLPLSSRSRQPGGDLRCAESPDLDVEIEVDAAGQWTRQVQYLTHADGRRVRVAEHTREIEYR
jgi:hypothetical protein